MSRSWSLGRTGAKPTPQLPITTVVTPCPDDGSSRVVPRGLAVVVGVDVDEARRDERAVGVDLAVAPRRRPSPTSTMRPSLIGDVGRARRRARAVDDRAAADHEVERHRYILTQVESTSQSCARLAARIGAYGLDSSPPHNPQGFVKVADENLYAIKVGTAARRHGALPAQPITNSTAKMVCLTAAIIAAEFLIVDRLLATIGSVTEIVDVATEACTLTATTAAVLWHKVIRPLRQEADAKREISADRQRASLID